MSNTKAPADLDAARKRAASLFGGAISFKRPRQEDQVPSSSHKSGDSPLGISPYGRCPSVSERYEKIGRVGEGTYGVVYKARDKESGETCALKRCLPHHEASDGFPQTTLREITILRELALYDHPGIVKLKDVAVSSSRSGVFLVFEYCEHDLANLIDRYYAKHSRSIFTEAQAKQLSIQLLSAIDFLHSRHLIHRDIKLSNILYNRHGRLRLADFGLCRRIGQLSNGGDDGAGDRIESIGRRRSASKLPKSSARDPNNLTPKVVSLWYRPPELLLGSDLYDTSVDTWGAGCCIAELLDGRPLVNGKSEMDQINKLFRLIGPPDGQSSTGPNSWPDLAEMPLVKNDTVLVSHQGSHRTARGLLDRFGHLKASGIHLLTNLLRYDRKRRWTAKEALHADYLCKDTPLPTHLDLMPTFPVSHI